VRILGGVYLGYQVVHSEIEVVEKAIAEQGYWEKAEEWRIFTNMISRIEPQERDGRKYFITTVKCEQEVMIPARTIERAILFMKVYQDFQKDLWHELGWASWVKKDKAD